MRKRFSALLLTMAMLLSLIVITPVMTITAVADDAIVDTFVASDATPVITTTADMKAFRDAVNGGNAFAGKTVYLAADVDISDSDWTPIGTSSNMFKGSFNGNGHTISGLHQGRSGAIAANVGLFGYVSSPNGQSTSFKNFKLTSSGSGIKGQNGGADAGTVISAVMPSSSGTVTVNISNIWSTANFDCGNKLMKGVGGILGVIGNVTSTYTCTVNIDSCRFSGTLNSPTNGTMDYAGIVGWLRDNTSPKTVNISNCLVDGNIILYGAGDKVGDTERQLDDNAGIIGYIKGNASAKEVHVNISDCIVAAAFQHKTKTTGTSNTGYIISEVSQYNSTGNASHTVTNVYYCNDADRCTGAAMGGWYGYNASGSSLITATNVTAKTMTELKALSSGFSDNGKWYFGTSEELPIPAALHYMADYSDYGIYANTNESTYVICSTEDMQQFAKAVNDGVNSFAGKTVYLGADIYTGKGWEGIGKCTSAPFSGSFDGQGHLINYLGYQASGADASRGLFNFIRIPENSTIYLKNVHVTGSLTFSGAYIGGVVSALDAGTTGSGGTLVMENVWASVNMRVTGGDAIKVGGVVGYLRQSSDLKPITLTFESCVWDGCIEFDPKAQQCGGFLGSTHYNNKASTINFSNSVSAGHLIFNTASTDDVGMFLGYAVGNQGSQPVAVNASNLVSIGEMTFVNGGTSGNWYSILGGMQSYPDIGQTQIPADRCYYYTFTRPGKTLPLTDGPGVPTVTNCSGYATKTDMLSLTTSSFSESAKWNKTAGYYPCPKGIKDTFGEIPASLYNVDISNITTAAGLQAVSYNVHNGYTYSGQTIKLGADIDLTGLDWHSIGSRNDNDCRRPFEGTFNGQNHTVTIDSKAGLQSEGGLIGYAQGATVQNVKVTGKMALAGIDVGVGFFGTVIGCVGTGTTTVTNVFSDADIYSNGLKFMYSGGFIGGVNNNINSTLTCTDCVYAGTIYADVSTQESGGFFGYSGQVAASNTKVFNFTRCVFAGEFVIDVPVAYIDDNGLLLGYMQNNPDNVGVLTVTITDCIVIGKMTFGSNASSLVASSTRTATVIGWAGKQNASTSYSPSHIYYFTNLCPDGLVDQGSNGGTSVATTAKTLAGMRRLTSSDFTSGASWNFTLGYYPCPSAIVTAFGAQDSFKVRDLLISTPEELMDFASEVTAGDNYAGAKVLLTDDVDLDGETWVAIGTQTNSFRGTFDGQGHTIANMNSHSESEVTFLDCMGGLFGSLGDGAVVKNFTLTGRMEIVSKYSSGSSDYFGSITGAIAGGTVLIQNIHSSVYIQTSTAKNSSDAWGRPVYNVGGLVGFIVHNVNANLTIDSCVYDGTINASNGVKHYAGIMAMTGSNSSNSKTVTIKNTVFAGSINLNDNGSGAYEGCAGILGYAADGKSLTVNIQDCIVAGKMSFNQEKSWTASNNGNCGQIIAKVDGSTTVNISNVYYVQSYLHTTAGVAATKQILAEIAINKGAYGVDVAGAHPMNASELSQLTGSDFSDASKWSFKAASLPDYYIPCPASLANPSAWFSSLSKTISQTVSTALRTVDGEANKGIRFSTYFDATAFCSNAGAKNADFGILLISKANYDKAADTATVAGLKAAGGKAVKAVKYQPVATTYYVSVVVHNITKTTEKVVAVAYIGDLLVSDTVTVSYSSLS